ncbi:MAG: hypothetical protein EXR07_09160 [Acetobacteraceae bacterium]|nr:hypothetical protein [Acetobacteraceae bacterium]
MPNSPEYQEKITDFYIKSLQSCAALQADLFTGQIGMNGAADIATTVLAGLASVLTPVNTVRGLAAAAAAVSGVKSTVSNDFFGKQAAGFGGRALNGVYFVPMKQLNDKWGTTGPADLNDAHKRIRDIADLNTRCSLESALAAVDAKLEPLSAADLKALVDAIKAAGNPPPK